MKISADAFAVISNIPALPELYCRYYFLWHLSCMLELTSEAVIASYNEQKSSVIDLVLPIHPLSEPTYVYVQQFQGLEG